MEKRKNKPYYRQFDEEELKGIDIDKKFFFRVERINGEATDMFFTQKFIDLVQEYGLKGIGFDEVGGTEPEE